MAMKITYRNTRAAYAKAMAEREEIDPDVHVGDTVIVTAKIADARADKRAIITSITHNQHSRPLYHASFIRGKRPASLYRSEFDATKRTK